jgi:hypothetical protein
MCGIVVSSKFLEQWAWVQVLGLHYFLYNYCLFINIKVYVVWSAGHVLRERCVGPTGHDPKARRVGRVQSVSANE